MWTKRRRNDDSRVICACQVHAAGRRSFAWRRLAAGLFVAVPLLMLFTGMPGWAYEVVAIVRRDPPKPPVVRDAPQNRELSILTPRVRRDFFSTENAATPEEIDRHKEQFFRARIPYGGIIYQEARKNGLPPELVAAVVEAESDFRPGLVSQKNAKGLMQIIPSTGELMGATDLLNPQDNVRAGTRYLQYLFRRFDGDQSMVLAAYNAGEGTVARFGGVPPYRETSEYLERVKQSRTRLEKKFATHLQDQRRRPRKLRLFHSRRR